MADGLIWTSFEQQRKAYAKGGVIPAVLRPAPRPDPGAPECLSEPDGRPDWIETQCSPGCPRPRRRWRWVGRTWDCRICDKRWTYDHGWREVWDDIAIARTERELGIGEDT